jgi:ABC-type branched-subunit amino acid transport system substrate-binding protein
MHNNTMGDVETETKGDFTMADKRNGLGWTGSNGLTRRRMVGRATAGGALAIGGALTAAMPLRYALAKSEPYKIGSIQPLSGGAASIGKTALVGLQVAVERINKGGGILGREVKLIAEDDESKPDVGRRKTEKLLVDDKVDATVGGVLSNICLACMPLYDRVKVVNMISVCLDTTNHREQVQPLHLPSL